MPSCAPGVWRVEAGLLFDVAGMGLAERITRSSISIALNGSAEKARSDSAMLSNHVSPRPSHSASAGMHLSMRLIRRPRKPEVTHDLGVPSRPVREELLARQPGLSANEADASDHGALTVRAAAGTIPA